MKKIVSFALLTAMMFTCLFAFSACNSGGNSKNGEISSLTYEVGNFSVEVPDGWTAFPAEGNANTVTLAKGAQSVADLASVPNICIDFYGKDRILMTPQSDYYSNAQMLEARQFGDFTWEGFTAESLNYPLAVLWTKNPDIDIDIQISIWLELSGSKISLDDTDVNLIISSIKSTEAA